MTLALGSTGDDVKTFQQDLKDGGYYNGPIDGDFGPDTEAAVKAFQTAHGLTVDGVVGAETWGNMHGDPKYPNNSTGALGGGSSDRGAGATESDFSDIKKEYPQLAYLIDDPEVGPILKDAAARNKTANPMPQSEFEASIMATNWWRTTASSARDYFNQQFADPATFQNKLRDYRDQVRQIGGKLGYDETVLTPDYVDHFANKMFREGLSASQIQAVMADEITPLGGTTEKSPALAQIRQAAQDWGLWGRIDGPTQNYWLNALTSGRQTTENMRLAFQQQASTLFPNLKDQFDQGLTFRQITEPYRQSAAKLLETDPQTLDFMGDPKWRHVVDYVDPKTGIHRTMSNVELEQYVKSQPEWNNTKNAVDTYSQIGQTLLQAFGAA